MAERPQGLKSIAETAFAGIQTTLAIARDVSGSVGVPGLQLGLMGLEVIIEISQEFLDNDDRTTRLLERIVNLDAMLQNTLSQDYKLPPQLYNRVVKIVRVWETEASKVSELRERNGALRWLTAKKDAELIQASPDAVNQSIQDFLLECAFNTETGILRLQHEMQDLKRLTAKNLHLLQRSTSQPPLSNEMTLKRLDPKDPVYLDVKSLFEDKWLNPKAKFPKIQAVYQISAWSRRGVEHHEKYSQYRTQLRKTCHDNRLVEEPLFHTHPIVRECKLGDDQAPAIKPCFKTSCSVCHILRCDLSSDLARNTDKGAFWGRGFYFTTASNKANFFSKNGPSIESPNHVVLLSKVLVGTPKSMTVKDSSLTSAPPGTHSIKAVLKRYGGVVAFSERVVYQREAICPWVVILTESLPRKTS